MSGKGSGRRPITVPKQQFEDNWDRIFGKNLTDNKKPVKKNTGTNNTLNH